MINQKFAYVATFIHYSHDSVIFRPKSFTTRAKPVSQLCFIYTFVLFPTNCKVRRYTFQNVAKLSLNRRSLSFEIINPFILPERGEMIFIQFYFTNNSKIVFLFVIILFQFSHF